jgi:hypothetical protein
MRTFVYALGRIGPLKIILLVLGLIILLAFVPGKVKADGSGPPSKRVTYVDLRLGEQWTGPVSKSLLYLGAAPFRQLQGSASIGSSVSRFDETVTMDATRLELTLDASKDHFTVFQFADGPTGPTFLKVTWLHRFCPTGMSIAWSVIDGKPSLILTNNSGRDMDAVNFHSADPSRQTPTLRNSASSFIDLLPEDQIYVTDAGKSVVTSVCLSIESWWAVDQH